MKQRIATALASTELLDAFTMARTELMVIVFAKTTSPYYKLAVNIASGASRYRVHDLDGSVVHLCAFGRTAEQAARADSLLTYTESWASTQVFAGGRLLGNSIHAAKSTLRCFQDASECTDHRAHCHTLATDALKTPPMSQGAGGLRINLSVYDGPAPSPPACGADDSIPDALQTSAFLALSRQGPSGKPGRSGAGNCGWGRNSLVSFVRCLQVPHHHPPC